MKQILIDGRPVGEGAPFYTIAEIGSNFDQDIDNLASVVKGTLGGGSPEEIAGIVGFNGESPISDGAGADLAGSIGGLFDQDVGNLASVLKGTLSGGSPEEIASLVGFDDESPGSQQTEE